MNISNKKWLYGGVAVLSFLSILLVCLITHENHAEKTDGSTVPPDVTETSPEYAVTPLETVSEPEIHSKITEAPLQDLNSPKIKYDELGNMFERVTYKENGELSRRELFKYLGTRHCVEWIRNDYSSGSVSRVEFVYSDEGELTSFREIDSDGKISVVEINSSEKYGDNLLYAGRKVNPNGSIETYYGYPLPE